MEDTQMPAIMDDKGNVEVTCDCGKRITVTNKYGMFCEDMCGYEESIKADKLIENMIHMLCGPLDG